MHDVVEVGCLALTGVALGHLKDLYSLRRTERSEARRAAVAAAEQAIVIAQAQAIVIAQAQAAASDDAKRMEHDLLQTMEALSEYQSRVIAELTRDRDAIKEDAAIMRVLLDNIPDILGRELKRLTKLVAEANERLRMTKDKTP